MGVVLTTLKGLLAICIICVGAYTLFVAFGIIAVLIKASIIAQYILLGLSLLLMLLVVSYAFGKWIESTDKMEWDDSRGQWIVKDKETGKVKPL